MQQEISVLLVGNHALLIDSLAARLMSEACCSVLLTARTPTSALTVVYEHEVNIVLMDIDMAETDCLNTAAEIRISRPRTSIILIGAMIEDQYVMQALRLGAMGFLLKSDLSRKLVPAFREAAVGGALFPEEVQSRIIIGSDGAHLRQPCVEGRQNPRLLTEFDHLTN